MNHYYRVIFIPCILFLLMACAQDSSKTEDTEFLEGVWRLTAWNISDAMDLNKDGAASVNILNEISCENNEILEFNTEGVAAFNNTFNPRLEILSQNSSLENLNFSIKCNSGVIGAATTYSKEGNTIFLGSETAIISGNEITIVRKNKLKILNSEKSEILASRDIDVVYTKQEF